MSANEHGLKSCWIYRRHASWASGTDESRPDAAHRLLAMHELVKEHQEQLRVRDLEAVSVDLDPSSQSDIVFLSRFMSTRQLPQKTGVGVPEQGSYGEPVPACLFGLFDRSWHSCYRHQRSGDLVE